MLMKSVCTSLSWILHCLRKASTVATLWSFSNRAGSRVAARVSTATLSMISSGATFTSAEPDRLICGGGTTWPCARKTAANDRTSSAINLVFIKMWLPWFGGLIRIARIVGLRRQGFARRAVVRAAAKLAGKIGEVVCLRANLDFHPGWRSGIGAGERRVLRGQRFRRLFVISRVRLRHRRVLGDGGQDQFLLRHDLAIHRFVRRTLAVREINSDDAAGGLLAAVRQFVLVIHVDAGDLGFVSVHEAAQKK